MVTRRAEMHTLLSSCRENLGVFLPILIIAVLLCGCGRRSRAPIPPTAPPGSVETGIASWYGHPFHGRKTANGETYDMEKMTAAHKTLPFDTYVEVRNLDNNKRTTVRINDRGPFVDGRVIDLSKKAAREIDMIGPGTAKVRLTILDGPKTKTVEGPGYTVQVGAFRRQDFAEDLARRLKKKYQHVSVNRVKSSDRTFYRVRVGHEPDIKQARKLAERLENEKGVDQAVVLMLK